MNTPWGESDNETNIKGHDGIVWVSTPSHGGFWLSSEARKQMPEALRVLPTFAGGHWYEEDCDATIVILAFPQYFTAKQVNDADTAARHIQKTSLTLRATRAAVPTTKESSMKTITITYDPKNCGLDDPDAGSLKDYIVNEFSAHGIDAYVNEFSAHGIDAYVKDGAITVPDGDNYALDDREHATVLAALRLWQVSPDAARGPMGDIVTNGGIERPLTADEIDALCERLNCGG